MTPATPNIAWVLRDSHPLTKKDFHATTGAPYEEIARWKKRRYVIEDVEYQARLAVLEDVFALDASSDFLVSCLRARWAWADGTTSTGRAAIRDGKRDEVLSRFREEVAMDKKERARQKHVKRKQRKHAKH